MRTQLRIAALAAAASLAHRRRPKLTVKVAFTASATKKATYATTTIGLR